MEKLMDDFIKLFNGLAAHKHRYNVFQDFITASAIALYNSIYKDPIREDEYLQIMQGYSKEEIAVFPELLGILVNLLNPEPRDVLGELYMSLDLGNQNAGQFFTPPTVSELMAEIAFDDNIEYMQDSFFTLSDPACGAGSTLLAFIKLMIVKGYNPADKIWIQAIDIDRTVALMCYIQLALWNVPAQVLVGDSLTLEIRECWFTPAHCVGLWEYRLKKQQEKCNKDKVSEKQFTQTTKPVEVFNPTSGLQLSLF